ncbi:uncharacterized acetyltransferase At3g50280 [Ziziphus jujuba]|uniref:Uncharacterized acetyltransferase At3g50280 n=2 Tax=Ziziphus jujuba TaxID=326968 RepID=A0A9B4JE98_ZIZJJ|nr:uncharacterized acetyltransferase At3g50280 [Ziziphus jujuba]XP_024932004.2 uncharacterized acetyltransferase At3g50280 [Ziziphus jujuba]XP_048335470.1 uncharacterized acetyltransferase At3g50280 [Ziziphus jujuba]XP_060674641.1 uncharacterized acetyltransferase At3g50280 [Ziziphus jujuba]KAH7520205.1 hypothetical protein FEM48_Zijuj08G0119500 [Ziziphus jujuba var. spinosa]
MTHIRFISTTTFVPTNGPADENESSRSRQRIELTPWDLQLLLLDPIQKGLLFHKPNSLCSDRQFTTNTSTLIDHLKATFSAALDIFHPLAGRLAPVQNDADQSQNSSFFLDCNGEGAEFIHAVVDGVTVADILEPIYTPDDIVYSFFPMNGTVNYDGISKPLLAVQVTELVDGIFIGCTINHTAADGSSFWHFFNTWSQISRRGGIDGGNLISRTPPPVFDRRCLDGIIEFPIRIPSSQLENRKRYTPPPLKQRMFRFSKETIAELKAKANSEMKTDKISSLQALLAHLWVSVTRNRNLNSVEEVTYTIIVGTRRRVEPKLADEYMGNSVLFGNVKSTAGELIKNGIGWAAWKMNRVIAFQTSEEVRKFLKNWEKSPKVPKLSEMVDPARLVTGSSPQFNVFGNDFGWGKPIAVRSGPGNKSDGKLTVFPGAEEGSIDFEACLSPQTLQALAGDTEFVKTLAS